MKCLRVNPNPPLIPLRGTTILLGGFLLRSKAGEGVKDELEAVKDVVVSAADFLLKYGCCCCWSLFLDLAISKTEVEVLPGRGWFRIAVPCLDGGLGNAINEFEICSLCTLLGRWPCLGGNCGCCWNIFFTSSFVTEMSNGLGDDSGSFVRGGSSIGSSIGCSLKPAKSSLGLFTWLCDKDLRKLLDEELFDSGSRG